ncbi:hypothetical protein F9K81_13790 [Brucella anthropi]|uniref:hypothetical protein n=1 Tax=Brucella anthropi TaxID=529 RepID=UPI00124C5460|nr:hypothetical protein [Brucella anthropi]KAB2756962.1 hypothetical protein F9K81_13790 [Brucella anthropi]
MSFHRARVDTIRAIIAGSPSLSAHHSFAAISNELEEVKSLMHVGLVRRRYLLAVLHATRALDVALKTFVAVLGLHHSPSTSLGKSLRYIELSAPTVLGSAFAMRQRFQASIVASRNRYMHEAGAFPASDYEIRMLLAEMEHCLAVVLALE